MIVSPSPLGNKTLPRETLARDKGDCIHAGPCGLGMDALYLGSRYFERMYYIPWGEVNRVFKRVAMSSGGFTGKGVFGSMAYLVVQFGKGQEKQCRFKMEQDVDKALEWIEQHRPGIPTHSEAAERKLAEAEAAENARFLKTLSPEADATLESLRSAKEYLDKRPGLAAELTAAAKQKRIVDHLKPGAIAAATVIAAIGVLAMLYGVYGFFRHLTSATYFLIGGAAAFFTTLSTGTLPSKWTSRKCAQQEWENAVSNVRDFLGERWMPVPAQYAHPVVLERMIRVVREGRAQTAAEALAVVKDDLRSLNSSVTVSQKEHDEVVAVKPLFLVCQYQDEM